jgi:hypothetical protein
VVVVDTWEGQPPATKWGGRGRAALGNVDCLPGTQVPRGFYLVEFKLNYSPTLESEKDAKIANWKACQLAH